MSESEELIGLIPAAGKGLRLGLPYPKELYPIIRGDRYKPVAQFALENLTAAGTRHVVFVINETKHQLIGYFGDGHRFGCDISYVVQERREMTDDSPSPGLANALDAAYHLIRGKRVLFGMADTIMTPVDVFGRLLDGAAADDDLVLGLFPTEAPEKFGMVAHDMAGRVERIVDKPARTELTHMWGCMAWRPSFTEHLHVCVQQLGMNDFARILNEAIADGYRLRGLPIEGSYADLGTYEEIAELDRQSRAK